MTGTPRLTIVIVNWNSGPQLRECLATLSAADCSGVTLDRVVVVDNASSDDSTDGLPDLGGKVALIRNHDNRGFAAACNQGARDSQADYLLFLNPDVRFFPDSLVRPIRFMEDATASSVGACGIQLVDEVGKIVSSCARFPTPRTFFAKMVGLDRCLPRLFPSQTMTEWHHRDSRPVDQVIGAFFLVRRTVFAALGGFDERFFLYFEEVDFSYRAHQLGWSSYFLAEARVYHRGNGCTDQAKADRLFYALYSRIQYSHKHFTHLTAIGVTLGTLLIEPLPRLALTICTRPHHELVDVLRGYSKLWARAPRLFHAGNAGRSPCAF